MKRDWGGVALPPPPRIATKAELDRLTENRPVPAPEPHLSPDGPVVVDLKEQIAGANESRINELQERLQRLRDGADRDFSFAQMHGRAAADFERSRE